MNAHSSLYSLSVYTHLPFILLGPASNKVKRYNLPHFKSAFDIPSWTFYAWIIDCVILLFKNEWMSLTVPFSSSLSASRPNTKKETSGVIKGKLSKQHKLAFFIYLFFKALLWYIRSTVPLFPPLWKGKGSNGGWLQAISPPPLHICISPVLLTQISALQLLWSNIWFLLITTLHVYAAFQKNNHSGPYSKKKASSFPLCLTAEGIRVGRR